jgi:anti-anti-sigma factor
MRDGSLTWRVDVEYHSGNTVLRVAGELDLETAPQLLAEADPHLDGPGGLIVDLSRLAFIDSSGLSALIRLNKRMSGTGRTFVIISPPPGVAKAFEITGLDQVLPLRPVTTADPADSPTP